MDHIVILGPAYPYRGGLASFDEMMARTFAEKGKKVTIITFKLQYPRLLFPGKTQFSDSPPPADLKIIRMINSVNPFNWFRVGRHIRKMRPDAVVVRYWTPFLSPCLGVISRIAGKNKHTVRLSQLDNIIPHEKHFFDSFLTRFFVRSVDGFIYMSQQVKNDLDQFTATKPSIFAPHPIFSNFGEKQSKEEACRCLALSVDKKYILFFGLIREYKGLDLMLEAWNHLKQSGMTADKRLIIAGEFYTDKSPYLQLAGKLGIGDEIIWHDRFIKDEEVKYYFSVADMIVQPYKSATQSGVTQIAYQFELPMIVTDVGGLAEIVPDGEVGLVVTPDAKEIARAIEKMYENEGLSGMTEKIKIRKQQFSWEHFTEQIEKLYHTVLTTAKRIS